jgi:hypothetical protein
MRLVMGGSAQRKGESLAAAGDAEAAKWLAGAEGERRVAGALGAMPPGWTVIHDRLLMPGLTESNLDHVVVGPPGVVLIDAKNFSGEVMVWRDCLYQHLGRGENRTSRSLVGELRKIHWMTVRMSERLGVPVTPVLCLAGDRQALFGEPALVCGVWVVAVGTLPTWLLAQRRRIVEEEARRLVPRVLSEFPSTTTDPELLAAIGRDLGKVARARASKRSGRRRNPAPPAPRAGMPPPRPPRHRPGRQLWRFLRIAALAGLLFMGAQHLPTIGDRAGALLGSFVSRGLPSDQPAPTAAPTVALPTSDGEDVSDRLFCDALSTGRLSSYVDVPVTAWHQEDGRCMWVTDPSDPRSVVVTAEQLSAASVAHLAGDTVSLTPHASMDPPGPTSVLLAREGQWIPVADRRTAARWPMKVEIMRAPLGIDDQRGQQILRAVAADLNDDPG